MVPAASIEITQREQMYELFAATYDCTVWERFEADLAAKDDVILLSDRHTGAIGGFSSLKNLCLELDGARRYGVYSGDTVVDRAYWGQRVLGRAFLAYLFRQRARHPLRPLFWVLLSKGYKTYLLMANNFPVHFPRHEVATPVQHRRVLDGFAAELFGADYDAEKGCVVFSESRGQLRPGIADVTDELCSRYPRVAYFDRRNPGWREGHELVCLAELSWRLPLVYTGKALLKLTRR